MKINYLFLILMLALNLNFTSSQAVANNLTEPLIYGLSTAVLGYIGTSRSKTAPKAKTQHTVMHNICGAVSLAIIITAFKSERNSNAYASILGTCGGVYLASAIKKA